MKTMAIRLEDETADLLSVVAQLEGTSVIDQIRQAIEASPNNALYYGSLGNALQDLRQLDQAIASFRHAIQLKPDLADAYKTSRICLEIRGKSKKRSPRCERRFVFVLTRIRRTAISWRLSTITPATARRRSTKSMSAGMRGMPSHSRSSCSLIRMIASRRGRSTSVTSQPTLSGIPWAYSWRRCWHTTTRGTSKSFATTTREAPTRSPPGCANYHPSGAMSRA